VTDVADRYGRLADAVTRLIDGCPPGAWTRPSPCEDWTAYDVAQHLVDVHRRVLTRLSGGDPTPPDSDDDLAAAWRVESGAVRSALADDRAQTPVESFGSTEPFEQLVGSLLCADTVIHTWDLARATGQDDRLDPESVASAMAFLEPNDAMLRRPGGFGPKVDPPEGADAQTRLLCFVGRRP